MSETAQLGLPLVEASQAQKHVTVNEAFSRIDALAQMSILSTTLTAPPASPADGDLFSVPVGGSGAWFGQDGSLALFQNGGGYSLRLLPGGVRGCLTSEFAPFLTVLTGPWGLVRCRPMVQGSCIGV